MRGQSTSTTHKTPSRNRIVVFQNAVENSPSPTRHGRSLNAFRWFQTTNRDPVDHLIATHAFCVKVNKKQRSATMTHTHNHPRSSSEEEAVGLWFVEEKYLGTKEMTAKQHFLTQWGPHEIICTQLGLQLQRSRTCPDHWQNKGIIKIPGKESIMDARAFERNNVSTRWTKNHRANSRLCMAFTDERKSNKKHESWDRPQVRKNFQVDPPLKNLVIKSNSQKMNHRYDHRNYR